MTAGSECTAWIHLQNQSLSMLIGHIKPSRKDQKPLANRIGLPVLFPAAAPVFIGQFVPHRLSQSQMEGLSQGHETEKQFRSLLLRPFMGCLLISSA